MKSMSPSFRSLAALAVLALALAAPASGQILFEAQLTGFAEVPPVATTAFGSCTGVLTGFPEDPSFHIACDHNVANAMAAHIHPGFPGEENPPTFGFPDPNDIDDTWNLSVDEAIRLLGGGYYVNVHTPANPDGEIRGQLQARQGTTAGVETLVFALTGDQEVPPVDSEHSGVCVAVVERAGLPEQGTLDLYCTHDVDDANLAHIHTGAVGVAGPPVVTLDHTSPIIEEDIVLTPQLASDLREGLLYVNVHTPANPGGEIRGQLTGCFSSTTVLCLANGRFAVEVDFDTVLGGGGSGQGVAVPETDNTGMFWFFEPSNLEIMIKVLDACPVNDRFWVFFAGLTNVGFDLTVTDTVSGEVNVYSNADETPVNPVLDTDAFDTCDVP
jgi:hypothetical protein